MAGAGIRVHQRLGILLVPAEQGMMIKDQKKKRVRADKPLAFFARLACTSPGKNRDKLIYFIDRVSGCSSFT